MEHKKKLSLSIRVDDINPAHVRLSVFSAMVLEEYAHDQVTRAKSGDLVLRVDEFGPFIDHIQPHIISLRDEVTAEDIERYTRYVLTPRVSI